MSNLKTEFNVDLDNPTHVAAMIAFLSTINGNAPQVASNEQPVKTRTVNETTVKETPVKETKTASKQEKKTLDLASKEEPSKEEVEQPKDEAPEKEDNSTIDIKEVREKLSTKINNNRNEIIDKLNALGASSVTTLHKDKYAEFVEFLEGLSD